MICSSRTPGQVRRACQEIAGDLAAEGCDPAVDLAPVDRRWLADLAAAIEVEASRATDLPPMTAEPIPKAVLPGL